jgi:flagellin
MALTVATNTGALMAQAAASSVNKDMELSMERLSTGKRINGASDDAAGVAIASRLTSEIRGTNQAIRNAMDGQALIDTAEGAHQEIENILQRMRELAVQGANDTNSTADRTALQAEMDALTSEIDRIAETTSWAGISLMDGSTQPATNGFEFQVGSRTATEDTINTTIDSMKASALSVSGTQNPSILLGTAPTTTTFALDVSAPAAPTLTVGGTATDGDIFAFTLDGISFSVVADIDPGVDAYEDSVSGIAHQISDTINDQGIAGVTASVTAAGEVTIAKAGGLSLASNTTSQTAIGLIDTAIQTVNTQRAELGAISNRLDSTVSNLTNISANLQAGRGRIEDADFAAETTSLAKSQILQQASTAMLAQANASKQNVLSLLQG